MEIMIDKYVDPIVRENCIYKMVWTILKEENMPENTEISIVFVNNEKIRELNHQYRGFNRPTNVLSFSMVEGMPMPFNNILGDVAISVEYAKKEAEDLGMNIEDRIIQLLIHGTLHLVGYDHIRDDDYEKMQEREEFFFKIWKKEKDQCI